MHRHFLLSSGSEGPSRNQKITGFRRAPHSAWPCGTGPQRAVASRPSGGRGPRVGPAHACGVVSPRAGGWAAGWGGTGGGPPSAYCHTTNQPTAGRLTATEVCCSSPFCPRLGSFRSSWARRGPGSEGEALAVPAGPGASPRGRPPARGCHEAWSAEPLCVPMASKREKVDAGLWNSPGVTFVGSEGHTESQPARV